MSYTTLISANELAKHLDQPDWVIFDCRFSLADAGLGTKAYRQGHLPGARYADLNKDLSLQALSHTGRHPLPDFAVLAKKLGDWGVSNRSQVVVSTTPAGPLPAACGGSCARWAIKMSLCWTAASSNGKSKTYR